MDPVIQQRIKLENTARKYGIDVKTVWQAVTDQMAHWIDDGRPNIASYENEKFESVMYAIMRTRGQVVDVF